MKKFMRAVAIGAAIIASLVLLGYHAARDKSTIEFINESDHKVLIVLLSVGVGTLKPIPLSISSGSVVHISVKNGRYAVFYKTDIEKGRGREKHIRIEEDTRYKFTEIDGELILKE